MSSENFLVTSSGSQVPSTMDAAQPCGMFTLMPGFDGGRVVLQQSIVVQVFHSSDGYAARFEDNSGYGETYAAAIHDLLESLFHRFQVLRYQSQALSEHDRATLFRLREVLEIPN